MFFGPVEFLGEKDGVGKNAFAAGSDSSLRDLISLMDIYLVKNAGNSTFSGPAFATPIHERSSSTVTREILDGLESER